MTRKSKSAKNKAKSSVGETPESSEIVHPDSVEIAESGSDAPVVIEAEAVDVTEPVSEDNPETAAPAQEASDEKTDSSDDVKAEVEPIETAATAPVEQAASKGGSSFFGLTLGGLLAGGIGYFVATQYPLTQDVAEPVDTSAFSQGIASNTEQLQALSDRIEGLSGSGEGADLSGVEASLAQLTETVGETKTLVTTIQDELGASIAALGEQADGLDQRLTQLETQAGAPVALSTEEELATFKGEVAKLTEDAEARLAEAQTKAAEAEAAAAAARAEAEAEVARAEAEVARQAALAELKTAVENGAAFDSLLENVGDVPDEITQYAESGVATLGDLARSFPPAARAALSVAETVPAEASAGERFSAFLKRQTNARSLTPRDGDGADAVLSRAEKFLGEGDLPATLRELDALPDQSKEALAEWLGQAEARTSALDALNTLISTN